MKPDYLWDGSGEPDPEVQRLEQLLGTLRSRRPAPEFPVKTQRIAWFRFAPVAAAFVLAQVVVPANRSRT